MSERAGFLSIRRAPRGPVLPGGRGDGFGWGQASCAAAFLPLAKEAGLAPGAGDPAPGGSRRMGWGGVGWARLGVGESESSQDLWTLPQVGSPVQSQRVAGCGDGEMEA